MSDKKKMLEENLKGLFAATKKSDAQEKPAPTAKEKNKKAAETPSKATPKSKNPEKADKAAPSQSVAEQPAPSQPAAEKPDSPQPVVETPVPVQSIEEKPVSPPEAAPVKTEKEKVASLAARPEPPTSLAVVEEAKQEDRKLLVFTLAGESYAVDVYAIRTTIKPQTVYLLPGTVPHLKGLINLRGEVVPVFDLRTRFAMPEKPIDDQTRFIVVEIGEYQASLIVDSVVGVETIPANLFEKPSGIVMTLDNRFLKSIVRYKDRLILNLNLAMVVSGEEKAGENEAED